MQLMPEADSTSVTQCPNCNHSYTGNYCPSCGQKNSVAARSKSLRFLVEESLHGFFHYDGKIFKAINYLLTKPGFLTEQYFLNRHQAYIKPFTLLVLFTLFLYFFGLKFHILHQFSILELMENVPALKNIISSYLREKGMTPEAFAPGFDAYKTSWQKIYYTLMVPFIAVACSLLLLPRKKFFVEHLVFSIHLVCTYILLLFIYLALLIVAQLILGFSGDVQWAIAIMVVVITLYTIIAFKKAYGIGWIYAGVAGLIISGFMVWMDLLMHNTLVSHLTFFFNYKL